MKNEQVNYCAVLIKNSTNKQEFNLKDKFLFDKLLNNNTLQSGLNSQRKINANNLNKTNRSYQTNRFQDKQVNNSDNCGLVTTENMMALSLCIPTAWQNVLQQIRLWVRSDNRAHTLQTVLKYNFLPQTALSISKQNNVIMVHFITDSSAVADRLSVQLRSLKSYLEKQLNGPVQVTLKSNAFVDTRSFSNQHYAVESNKKSR